MDFGFGTFLEKFEEHFGKWPLRILLLLVGLAVSLFCAKMIWDIALAPLLKGVSATDLTEGLSFAFWTGMAWFGGFAITALITASLAKWRLSKTLSRMLDKTEALDAEMQAAHHADVQRVDEIAAQAEKVLRELEARREGLSHSGQSDAEALKKGD